jgi:glycosyltransferase involved in cell wall biosynthesis
MPARASIRFSNKHWLGGQSLSNLVLHTRVVTGGGGGPEKTIINSPRFLADQGFPMLCAYMRHPDDTYFNDLLERAREKSATILPVDDNGPLDWRILQRFNAICAQHRPTIWHAHDYKSNFFGLFARRRHPMRLITTVHGWVEHTWKTPLYYAIDHRVLPRYEHVVCVSTDLYDKVRSLGIPESRCTYVPNGIDTDEFKRQRPSASVKPEFDTDPRRLVIGAVGRLSAEKGFHLLIEAFAKAQTSTGVDAELWIAGEGREQARLLALIETLNVADRVKLLGFRRDTIALFHGMDVFVLSSIREGLPNVVLEAMALSVPVLCTRIAGVPGLIEDECNGLLTEPGSADALQPGLERFLRDSDLRKRLGARGRETVETSNSFALRMQRIKEIYERVLATPQTV